MANLTPINKHRALHSCSAGLLFLSLQVLIPTSAIAQQFYANHPFGSQLRYPNSGSPYVHNVVANFNKQGEGTVQDEPLRTSPANSTELDNYVADVYHSLAREWRLSQIQTRKFPSIAFGLDKHGNLTELRITRSSDNDQVDEAALNVARRVAPFRHAPDGLGEFNYTFEDKKEQVDLSQYMHDLQRKIRHAWRPPHDLQEDHVIVTFKVHRDGRVDTLTLTQASASEPRNQACLNAVKNAAPFQHLPDGAPDAVDVQFNFDHKILSKDDE